MGTLFAQRIRAEAVEQVRPNDIAGWAKDLMREHEISYSDALETIRVASEIWLNDHRIHDMDVSDEKAAGFGELIQELGATLSSIVQALEDQTKE